MARKASPARLVIALSVAAVLAVFLLYTSIAGGGNPSLAPSELAGRTGRAARGPRRRPGARRRARGWSPLPAEGHRRRTSTTTVAVRYTGSVPDLFKVGRHIVVDGQLGSGTFVAEPGSMITKCPSKYAPKKSGDSA